MNIVVDEVNISCGMREDYIVHAQDEGYHIKAVRFPVLTREESVRRRLSDPHGEWSKEDWEGVWEKFNKAYDEPVYEEGFDEIERVEN